MNQEQTNYWEQQKNGRWKTLTNSLKNDPEIHAKINNLITTFYWKFRESKRLPRGTYDPEIEFLGFEKFEDFPDRNGHCESDIKIKRYWQTLNGEKVEGSETKTYHAKLSICLNQHFLLDRLGMDKLFSSEKCYTTCGFNELIYTISHEIAHAFQTTLNLKKEGEKISQCESTGKRDSQGNLLYPQLAAEHTRFTSEIKNLIENSVEYQSFKKWWTTGKQETQSSTNNLEECSQKRIMGNQNAKLKTCDGCGKKVPATELFLGNHQWGSDDIGKNLCSPCLEKAKKKQQDKVQEPELNADHHKNAPCPGGCGRRIQRETICSYEDCVRNRGYFQLDEADDFIQCSECEALHCKDIKGNSKYCANCRKTTAWGNAKLKFNEKGEYQIIKTKQKTPSSPAAGLLIFGGIVLGVILIAGLFFWLGKRKKENE